MWAAPRQNLCLSFLHSPAANAVAGISKAIIATVKCFIAGRDFWSAVAKDGKTRLKFVIEGV